MCHRLLIALCPSLLLAQTATFEAASIKPTQHGRDANGWAYSDVTIPSPGRLEALNSSLDELIRYAYDLKDYQLSGPHWLNDDSVCFDISATAPGATQNEMRAMLQTLLAERFHLQVRRETRELPIYKMVPAKGGPKLKPAASETGAPSFKSNSGSSGGAMSATGVTMADFAAQLSRDFKRPVFDQTGLTGRYDFSLHYDETGMASAIQQQLGLRVESAKAPVEVLVVDSIDRKPTEN
jgi:uncharacterized protein (TIGR03435 family)